MKSCHSSSLTVLAMTFVTVGSIASSYAASVKFEAESGALGANLSVLTNAGTVYISTTSIGGGNVPSNNTRVVTFNVSFPEAGTYDLYARVRVGAGGASDDSLFYGNGFGTESPTVNADWITVNNLSAVGFTAAGSIVTGGGNAGSGVWKWINLSEFDGGEAPITFVVTAGNLNQTFQIGARENGLDMDAFVFGTFNYTFTVAELDAGGPGTPPPPPPPPVARDLVSGNLIQFNDNGTWSWYMDERAVIDTAGGKLIAGSDASGSGVGGSPRNGAVEAVIFDLKGGTSQRSTLFIGAPLGSDDHNAPAFMVRPDGKYLSQWTGHNSGFLSYFSIYNGSQWEPFTTFDWETVGAVSGEQASYSNPHYLSAEDRTYTFVRSLDIKSMNILVSTNYGDTWKYYGKLNRRYPSAGYNPGYYRFSDNGVDRIDFICTESHPRDTLTSMYHGYISNGMSFKTDGTVVDSNLNDTNAPLSSDFTPVFTNGTVMPPGQTNYRCWNSDVQHYPDGTVQAIIHARINQSAHIGGYPDQEDPNHAFFFCRYDGTNWTSTYLCQAGYKMYSDEADYVGLGALNPSDPNTIYISTKYDPRAVQPGFFDTNQQYSIVREIWKGVTTNHGASFTWTPITRNSTKDNFRPVVPVWNENNTALLWFRGTYNTAQIFDAVVVGIIDHKTGTVGPMTYVDATDSNTTLINGSPLTTTGPDANAGADDDQWHERTGFGNGGSVLTSSETGNGENAPALKTQISIPQPGTYDVWVNFWALPGADWRIEAGLSAGGMQIFRQMASKEVELGDHSPAIAVSNVGGIFLYQAYLGRVTNTTVDVFVDDEAIQTGSISNSVGDTARTWYDGISYAQVSPAAGLPYDIWVAGYSLSGGNALTNIDYESDGLPNAVEFVLGGNPTVDDSSTIRPTYNFSAGNFEYDFRRADVSNVSQGYVGDVYYSTDLVNWTKAVNGVSGIVISAQNDFYGAGVDKVSVQLPNSLAAGGQLFVRLGVSPAGP